MEAREKENVLNPLTLRSTVGEELADIFEARKIENYESLIGIKDLRKKDYLSDRSLKKVAKILNDGNVSEYLSRFQEEYLEEKPKYAESFKKSKELFSKLKDAKCLLRDQFTGGYDVLEDIFDFFDIDTEEELIEQSDRQVALFRTQNNVEVDKFNLHAWLRRGELDFLGMSLPDYNEEGLMNWIESREWHKHIEDVSYFKQIPSILSKFGVGIVYVQFLPKTVYGAIRWIDNKPLIQISDRNNDLASCWFTLFHEFGHAIQHRNVDIYEGEINDLKKENKCKKDQSEREANKFANHYLFNGDNLRKAIFQRKGKQEMHAISLAKEFSVHPIFVSYWLLKAQYQPRIQDRISVDFSC
ncbi:ImmA/IrrE family metallo-endopeptidase [Tannerella forsythia]|uniref:ImmA/IrrE family metallo-endopeptidase n=1 Tax=Tannerella forsythia TaxID=28112 RepID=UPI0028ECA117|nr:ImmA/IrrE family metallo-endopeptidase [Tannerella forsythia]